MTEKHPVLPLAAGALDRITCGAELANLPALLATVAAMCRRELIGEPTCHDLQLIAEEACVNVMRHAYPAGQVGQLTLEVRIVQQRGPRRVVLTLEDQGKPFDPLTVPPVDTNATLAWRAPGGLGVHLIRALSDRQHYQCRPRRGNVLTIEKYLVPPASY